MINIGEYTKEELAQELNYNTDKASNITKRLTSLGYSFTTSGKGRTYRIYITALRQTTLKEFAEKYLGISARFEDRLAHFLQLLFTTGQDKFANMSASSLEWHTYSNNDTIQKWLDSLIDCGLLQEDVLVDVYYATRKLTTEDADDDGNYKYTQEYKEITAKEYEKAISAFSEQYKALMTDIDKNPELAKDEVLFWANVERKAALDGWWARRKPYNYKTVINISWPYYNELLGLLDNFKFENYVKEKTSNAVEELDAWEKRVAEWEKEKAEKRKKLQKEAEAAAMVVVEETEEVDTSNKFSHYQELKEAIKDMPIVDNFRDYLVYIQDNIIKGKQEVAKYYV